MNRRAFVAGAALLLACRPAERCKNCGMKIDPASPWRAELVDDSGHVTNFDTPRCALQVWRSGAVRARALRVQEYYDRQFRDGATLRFVVGGDVTGPMGPDFVPVDPSRATKFVQDHGADRALKIDEITLDVIANLK